jgi:hypothetical protein
MKALTPSSQTKLSPIRNIGELQAEARRISDSLKVQETALRAHLKKLPKEAVKAGMGGAVPSFLNNKVAGLVLTVGSAALGNYLLPKAAVNVAGLLGGSSRKEGIAALADMAVKWFQNRKKKKAGK